LKKLQLLSLLTLINFVLVVFVESVQAQVNKTEEVKVTSKLSSQIKNTVIPYVSELTPAVTNAALLLAQEPEKIRVVQITEVTINSTATGIEIVLETPTGVLPQPITQNEGKTLIVDIPNAVLALPNSQEFRADNPAPGIQVVSVTQNNASNVRVNVTGESAVPIAQVIPNASGLVLSLTPAAKDSDIELTVTGNPTGYSQPNTAAVTKTDIPLRDLPFSVQVVPQQVIQDQKALNVYDAVRNISGFALSGQGGGRNEFSLLTRGFSADQFRDGFSEGNNSNRVFTEISNLERIEVLKGPAAILYGQSQPGGVVNLVTKKPQAVPYYAAEYNAGSFGLNRGTLDLTGPLASRGNFNYRLNLAYDNSNSFRQGVESDRFFISPKFSLNLSPKTTLNLTGEYLEDSRPVDFGLVAVGNQVANIPISRFLGDPSRKNNVDQLRGYVSLEHRFSDNWSLRSNFRTTNSNQDFSAIFGRTATGTATTTATTTVTGTATTTGTGTGTGTATTTGTGTGTGAGTGTGTGTGRGTGTGTATTTATGTGTATGGTLLSDNRTLLLSAQNSTQFASTNYLQTDLIGQFSTGAIKHKVLFGFQLGNEFRNAVVKNASAGSIDIFNPVYQFSVGSFTTNQDRNERTNLFGVYLQNQVALSDNLKVLLGGRFDAVDYKLQDNLRGTPTSNYSDAFSPQLGIIYQPIQPISFYANYSRSFTPQSGTSFNGVPFQPEKGTQYEVGAKTDLFDGRFSTTLAFFDITKTNVLTSDPLNPTFSIQTGEQHSRGVELDVRGEILPGWNIIASYAYTDATITADNTFPVGNNLANVPRSTLSFWTTYTIPSGDLQGLGFGAGVFVAGDRPGDLNNSFTLPGYTRVDAAISYNYNNFRAALNIKNLFDTRYFESAQSRTGIFPGAPLTVIGTISLQF
jgi:outer membrane receptor protein involved in Fe transport